MATRLARVSRGVRPSPAHALVSSVPSSPQSRWSTLPESIPPQPPPNLLAHMRPLLRLRHYRDQTEKTSIYWSKRFIFFHEQRQPRELGKAEVEPFLTALAVDRHVSAATHNQALHALLFLSREVLAQELGWLDNLVPANARSAYRPCSRDQRCAAYSGRFRVSRGSSSICCTERGYD
jgi:hypothetical protein